MELLKQTVLSNQRRYVRTVKNVREEDGKQFGVVTFDGKQVAVVRHLRWNLPWTLV